MRFLCFHRYPIFGRDSCCGMTGVRHSSNCVTRLVPRSGNKVSVVYTNVSGRRSYYGTVEIEWSVSRRYLRIFSFNCTLLRTDITGFNPCCIEEFDATTLCVVSKLPGIGTFRVVTCGLPVSEQRYSCRGGWV